MNGTPLITRHKMRQFFVRKGPWLALLLSLLLWALGITAVRAAPQEDITVGWVESLYIEAIDTHFNAKLDTGAKTSSIGADILDVVEYTPEAMKEGKSGQDKPAKGALGRIIFTIEDDKGVKKTLERDIVRWARIKRKGNAGFIRRPVVKMRFCLAGHVIEDEVNLAVRSRFIYPVLIGRNMLEKGGLVVDASRKMTAPSTCPKKPSPS